jgi:hypothetical protein
MPTTIMAVEFLDWETIAPAMNYLLPIIVGLLGVMVFLVVEEPPEKKGGLRKWFKFFAIVSIPLAVFGFVAQFEAAKHQKQFNMESIRYYQEKFDSLESKRSMAASEIYEYLQKGNWNLVKNTEQLDSILDFFEDLGFYSENKQISDVILHQEFYSQMRTYCQPAERYIKETEIDEPADWNHVLPLFQRLTKIEAEQSKNPPELCVRSDPTELKYVQAEIALTPMNAGAGGNTYIQSVTNASQSTFLNGIQASQLTVAPVYSTKNVYEETSKPIFRLCLNGVEIKDNGIILISRHDPILIAIGITNSVTAIRPVMWFAAPLIPDLLIAQAWKLEPKPMIIFGENGKMNYFQCWNRGINEEGLPNERALPDHMGFQMSPLTISTNYTASSIPVIVGVYADNSTQVIFHVTLKFKD